MSKSFKRKKKWYDDEYDVNDNQRRINKERRKRKETEQSEAQEEYPDEDHSYPQGWRGNSPKR